MKIAAGLPFFGSVLKNCPSNKNGTKTTYHLELK
jgi:hypothetical protein